MVVWTHHVLKLALFFPKELRRFIDRSKMIIVLKVLPTLNLESEWITVLFTVLKVILLTGSSHSHA